MQAPVCSPPPARARAQRPPLSQLAVILKRRKRTEIQQQHRTYIAHHQHHQSHPGLKVPAGAGSPWCWLDPPPLQHQRMHI
jgi:hypothetical protein